MRDRVLWIAAAVILAAAAVVAWMHRTGRLQGEDSEGVALVGGPGEDARGHIPAGWRPPPPIGSDSSFRGPNPSAPMRFSPYAMSTSKRVLRRTLPSDNGDPGMAERIAEVVRDVEGRIGYVGPRRDSRFRALEERIGDVDAARFDGTDGAPVAEALRREGFAFLLVSSRDPQPEPWMEAGAATLRIRLRDSTPLDHFHPVVFGRSHVLYRIAPPMDFSQADRTRITEFVRAALTGRETGPLGIERPADSVGAGGEHRAIISLRARRYDRLLGRRIASRSEAGATLEEALSRTVDQLERDWDEIRAVVTDRQGVVLPAELAEAMDRIEIEVEVVDRMCHVVDRHRQRLLWQFELGREGMYLVKSGRFHFMSPATPIQRASGEDFRGEFGMVERFMDWSELRSNDWLDTDNDFGRFETHHWLETQPGGEVVALYRNVPLVTLADVTRQRIIDALRLGAMWLVNNQLDDGQFRYRYKPLEESPRRRWISGNNIVRHALNPYTLLLVNRVAPDERIVESARRGLAFTIEHIRRERLEGGGERCYVWHRDVPAPYENAKMGTVAVTILSILAMASVMDIGEYEDVLACLGEELLYVQDPNGHFRQYDVPPEHAYYGCENTIFPGEMMLALARMYDHTRDRRYRDAFDRAMEWYGEWWELNVDNDTRDGVYNEEDRMNLVGFVPWTVMAMEAMHRRHPEDRYADFAFLLQDWMDRTFLFDAERSQYPDYIGAYFKRHNELPAINSSGYTEGAAAAYALSLRTGRDVERRRRVLILGVRFALQIQYEGYATTYYVPDPETAMGGFRYNLNFSRSRNDYSYHAMSALSQALEYLRPQDYPAVSPVELPATLADALGEPAPAEPEEVEAAEADGGPRGDAGAEAGAGG